LLGAESIHVGGRRYEESSQVNMAAIRVVWSTDFASAIESYRVAIEFGMKPEDANTMSRGFLGLRNVFQTWHF